MDDASSLRNTKGIHARIAKIRKDLVTNFDSVLNAATTSRTNEDEVKVYDTDRASTAVAQLQMQVSTASLIKSAEDMQTLVRQLQEIWLFGRLDTLAPSASREQADADARAVAHSLAHRLGQHEEEHEEEQQPQQDRVNGGGHLRSPSAAQNDDVTEPVAPITGKDGQNGRDGDERSGGESMQATPSAATQDAQLDATALV